MKMSEEMAVRLHRMMWSDMQRELGDTPSGRDRNEFKEKWIKTHFPGESVYHNCFLCEHASRIMEGVRYAACSQCPIKWPDGTCVRCSEDSNYMTTSISKILALPAKNEKDFELTAARIKYIKEEKASVDSYYRYREDLLSKASGLPASTAIDDHVKAIKEKAVDEYFEKTPGAKLATMDVDQAFKQYAKEQKEPIFKRLAEESGLDVTATVKAHIDAIYSNGFDDGKGAERERILDKIGEMFKK